MTRSPVPSIGSPSRATLAVVAAWTLLPHWTGTLAWRRVGCDAVNSVSHSGYATVANRSDKAYATSVSVIGGSQVLAPGAPRTLKVGAQFQF